MERHRIRWYVYTGEIKDGVRELIPLKSTMRGFWPGYDVKCSCTWETKTGGGTRAYIKELIWEHRERTAVNRKADDDA